MDALVTSGFFSVSARVLRRRSLQDPSCCRHLFHPYLTFFVVRKKETTDLDALLPEVFAGELDDAGDGDEQATLGGDIVLAVDGIDVVELEGEGGELGDDGLRALDLVALERQHRPFLVQSPQRRPVLVERLAVVLRERPGHHVRIARSIHRSLDHDDLDREEEEEEEANGGEEEEGRSGGAPYM
ncbi:hypothetical protein ACMD2_13700 [Ananas comosus]|uniref:Uncharacterized protein n=1 Tax=Ananas comosus TaxID=4615 RepID=A0A199UJP0_ANACO|nr:hypothetical protein ACMD2_13700 [Ananas comosus]